MAGMHDLVYDEKLVSRREDNDNSKLEGIMHNLGRTQQEILGFEKWSIVASKVHTLLVISY